MPNFRIPYICNKNQFHKFTSFIVPGVVIVLTYAFPQQDIKSLMIFLLLIFVFSVYKFDSRILIGYGVILLVITAILTFQQANDSARQVAVMSYWIFSSGVICLLIDFYRNQNPFNFKNNRQ
jgi:hypothetical protein